MKLKHFLLNDENIEKSSYIWNMAGSMLMAFQSVIMLMILTRTVGLAEAGVFTIAYANASLFLNIGKYGMRNFQVSDVYGQFSFIEYLRSRWMTTLLMIIVSIAYIVHSSLVNNYSFEKSMVIIWMCLFKIADAIEDVYYGMYQQKGRLDIAAKAMTLRMFFTIIIFGIGIIVLHNQLISLIIATMTTFGLLGLFLSWTYGTFNIKKGHCRKGQVTRLLKSCFPLFAGAFLSFYIGNAPKYAIDALLSDELQACYGFIAMPVFVIGLLNSFIFNPILFQMSCLWNEGKVKRFIKRTIVQIGVVVGITIICIIGAYFLGTPVLSVLYNTNLAPYKKELLLLLAGGGFLGLTGLLSTVITIIRFQKGIAWGYAVVAVLAYIFSNPVVSKYGIMGAVVLYVVLMVILCLCFAGLFISGIYIKSKKRKSNWSII